MSRPLVRNLLILLLCLTLPSEAGSSSSETVALPDPAELIRLVRELSSDDSTARSAARKRLIAAGQSATSHLLARAEELAGSERWRDRWEIVNVFGYTRDQRGLALLVESVVGDANPHVRWRAGWAMTALDPSGARAREMLLAEARSTPSPFRRWNAWVGLGMYGDARAYPAVRESLLASDFWTRWEAVDALGRVRGDDASQRLECHLEDPESSVRTTATAVLGRICDETAKQLLTRLLESPESQIRWRAAMGLGRCNDPRYLDPLLRRLAEVETDEETVRYLREAVIKLEKAQRKQAQGKATRSR